MGRTERSADGHATRDAAVEHLTGMVQEPSTNFMLVQDATLGLIVDGRCVPLLKPWLPLTAEPTTGVASTRALVSVACATHASRGSTPPRAPSLRLGSVAAWVTDETQSVLLLGHRGASGSVDLARRRAHLEVQCDANGGMAADLQPMLTISSALLLSRIDRLLLHAGAVTADDGRAWLVVGDARSGKSTTCLSLAASGWALLSDDQVVLHAEEAHSTVEGWLRPLHLDEGWSDRMPTGMRRTVDPSDLAVRILRGPVTVAGTLHTSVAADQPTALGAISASEAFVGFVRQSPWLLADRMAAPRVIDVLSALARLPRFALRLGRDTFGDPIALRDLLTPTIEGAGLL